MCQARAVECNELKEPSAMEITTVGLDIAKRVFQLHGVDAASASLRADRFAPTCGRTRYGQCR